MQCEIDLTNEAMFVDTLHLPGGRTVQVYRCDQHTPAEIAAYLETRSTDEQLRASIQFTHRALAAALLRGDPQQWALLTVAQRAKAQAILDDVAQKVRDMLG